MDPARGRNNETRRTIGRSVEAAFSDEEQLIYYGSGALIALYVSVQFAVMTRTI